MRYNLRKYCKKSFALAVAVAILFVALASDCLAFEESASVRVGDEEVLFIETLVSDGGGCIEITLGSSRSACGVLATLSYDPEWLSFLTFVKNDALSEQITVSCLESNGNLRILIDSDENFDGVWCRFFFAVNETKLDGAGDGKLLSEIAVSTDSAYEKSESGYGELIFDDVTVRLDLSECFDHEQGAVGQGDSVSVRWIDLNGALEKRCAMCLSGFSDKDYFAAGFEITVSSENLAETYTVSRVLPASAGDAWEYAVIVPLPFRDSFYVTAREIGYSGKNVIVEEKTHCFFVCGSNIERVGSD